MLVLPMRKILAFLFALAPLAAYPQNPIPPEPGTLGDDLRTVASFYPRLEGSAGERAALSFITARLSSDGIPYSIFDFSSSDFQHSFSSCVRVDVKGARTDTLIVAVPLDNPPDAGPSEDGSVDIVLALSLLRGLKDAPPPLSVTVLFLGAEFGDTPDYPMGSTLFLRDFRPDYRAAVLYLNLRSVPDRLVVRGGGSGIVAPYWLIERTVVALARARLAALLRDNENQVFRVGLGGSRTIIDPFLQAGYPSVSLEGEYAARTEENAQDWLLSFSLFFSEFLRADSGGIPEQWDRHYLLFPLGAAPLLVPEKAYVMVLAAALAGALLYSLSVRRGMRKYLRTLARNSPSILPILALPFVLLLLGTLALEGILRVRRFSSLWSYAPLLFLALKLSIPFLAFSASYPLLRRLPFSRNGSFYSAAAIFLLVADILVVAALNISFTPYFLWALAFVLIASIAPNRWAKLLLFLPSAFLGVQGLIEVFLMPALPFCRFILLSRVWGNLLFAGFSLPFILYGIRLGLVFRSRGFLGRTGRTILAVCLLGGLSVALTVMLLRFSPFGPGNPQPLLVSQSIDGNTGANRISLESPAPIGDVTLRDAAGDTALHVAGSEDSLPLPSADMPMRVSVSSDEVLNKRNLSLSIASGFRARSLHVRLTSAEDFILLDSSFPAIRESGREYRLLVGAFPPDPLSLQLTLPTGMSFTLSLALDLDAPLIGVEVLADHARVQTRLHLVKSFLLRT